MRRARLYLVMHAVFYLLLVVSTLRLIVRHGIGDVYTAVAMAMACALGAVYGIGLSGRAWGRRPWLAAVVVLGIVLIIWAPSYAWCAIPLFFLCLRLLPGRQAIGVAVLLTVAVVGAKIRTSDILDPSLVLGPIAVATLGAVVFIELERTGRLEERERLGREIHDTLVQGLSSIRIVLQAAERAWPSDPARAREYVGRAIETAGLNLAEARRFVDELHPPDLDAGSLPAALERLCARSNAEFQISGVPFPAPAAAQAALLRVAQQGLANAAQHARAGRVAVTLSYLPGEVALDVRDDGVGFDPADPAGLAGPAGPAVPPAGHGLRAMRERLGELGGDLVIESAHGEGTAIAATIPVEGR